MPQSYMDTILDDNNRKPFARTLDQSQRYLGIFDNKKTEDGSPFTTLTTYINMPTIVSVECLPFTKQKKPNSWPR